MVEMVINKTVVLAKSNRSMLFLRIGRRMLYCSTPEICFLQNIKMERLSLFMEVGTVLHYRRQAFAWCLFLLKMESLPAIMKCLPADFPEKMYLRDPMRLSIAHVA